MVYHSVVSYRHIFEAFVTVLIVWFLNVRRGQIETNASAKKY